MSALHAGWRIASDNAMHPTAFPLRLRLRSKAAADGRRYVSRA